MTEQEAIAFSGEEIEALRRIVNDWLDDGFTTPPYSDAQYGVFEKLGATSRVYDTQRPS